MPQLDLIVYYPQFLWFSLGFSFFYLIILYKIIPTIAFSLKFRKKKSLFINNFHGSKKSFDNKDFACYYDIFNKVFYISRSYIIKVNSQIVIYIKTNSKKIDFVLLKQNNYKLIKKLTFFYLSYVKTKTFLT